MAGNVPMMMHITDSSVPLPELIAPLQAGDNVTHCYHGRNHFNFRMIEKALDQGSLPDTRRTSR